MAFTSSRKRSSTTSDSTKASSSPSKGSSSGWAKSGSGIAAEAERLKEAADRKRSSQVSRFWLKEGETREILVMDSSPDGLVAFHEHHFPDPQTRSWKDSIYEACAAEFGECCLCAKGDKPHYAMHLTVLDLTPFMINKGKQDEKEVRYSRKLLSVKMGQIPQFMKIFQSAMDKYGTIRGMVLRLSRGPKGSRIGDPTPIDGAMLYEMMSAEEILAEYAHPAYKNKEGKVLKKANADLEPFHYLVGEDSLFSKPDPDELRRIYGGAAPAGNAASIRDEWGDQGSSADDASQDEQSDDASEEVVAARSRTRVRARPSAPSEAEEDVPFGD